MNRRSITSIVSITTFLMVSCGQRTDIQEGGAAFGTARHETEAEVFQAGGQDAAQNPREILSERDQGIAGRPAHGPTDGSRAHGPMDEPLAHDPTDEPLAHDPTNEPLAHGPTDGPLAHEPTNEPIVQEPAVQTPGATLVSENDLAENGAAIPPVAISGAYLSCSIASIEVQLACRVKDAQNKAINFAKNMVDVAFAFRPVLSLSEVPATFTAVHTAAAGTYFFIDNSKQNRGLLLFNLRQAAEQESLSLSLTPLYAPAPENVRQAVAVSQIPRYDSNNSFSTKGYHFGDGDHSTENDSCLAGRRGTKVSSFRSAFSLNRPSSPDLYMTGMCGLQTDSTSVVFNGSPPFRSLRIYLMPGLPNLMLVQKLALPEGSYTVDLDHRVRAMPDGTLDDFTFSSLIWGNFEGSSHTSFAP